MMIQRMINYLPLDVLRYIIPYTYQIQNKALLHDIKDYNKSKLVILDLYYEYWVVFLESIEHKEWLINDLFAYANNDQATMLGYTDDFYKLFSRNTRLTSKIKVNNYIQKLSTKEIDTQINVFWGLLLPKERKNMIEYFKRNHML